VRGFCCSHSPGHDVSAFRYATAAVYRCANSSITAAIGASGALILTTGYPGEYSYDKIDTTPVSP
jgi:hypothetical protein